MFRRNGARKSHKSFRNRARKTHPLNLAAPRRGGIRL